jgi:hypothetical protein
MEKPASLTPGEESMRPRLADKTKTDDEVPPIVVDRSNMDLGMESEEPVGF